jgi:hypothetical protein
VIQDVDPMPGRYARVDTDVSPETAEVYLDGTRIGQADDFDGFPDYLYLEPGKYVLEFRHPSYETIHKEIEVREGQAISMNDDMKLLPGKKKLEVVDPEDKGTPLGRVFGSSRAPKEEPAGDRTGRFDVVPGGEAPAEDLGALPPLPPPAGDVGDVAPADRGRFRFEVRPDDAAVYLDDKYIGTGEELAGLRRGFPVRPGKHVITVVRPGWGTRTIEVEAKPATAIDVVVELEK